LNSHIATEIPVARTKTRRSARALAVFSLGPLTVVAGLAWAILQPYRVTLLHPHGQGFWWLFVEPPLLVMLVGVLFHLLVAPGVVEDLEEADAPHAPGTQLPAPHPAASGVRLGGAGLRPAEPSRPGA
jgi:hypothetical protein